MNNSVGIYTRMVTVSGGHIAGCSKNQEWGLGMLQFRDLNAT